MIKPTKQTFICLLFVIFSNSLLGEEMPASAFSDESTKINGGQEILAEGQISVTQDPNNEVTEYGNAKPIPGEPLKMIWQESGREATAYRQVEQKKSFATGLKMSKNTCTKTVTPRCYFKGDYQIYKDFYIWTKHPNPEKIGKILEKTDANYLRDLSEANADPANVPKYFIDTNIFTPSSQMEQQNITASVDGDPTLKDRIVCDNFDWLPAFSKIGDENIIPGWFVLFEFPVMEFLDSSSNYNIQSVNQFLSAAKNVKLVRASSAI